MGFAGKATAICALAAGVCLLTAASATAAKESAVVKLGRGGDISGRIVETSKACKANRTLRFVTGYGGAQIGSVTSNSKGKFFLSLVYSGSVSAVATKTKKCRKAKSEMVPIGAADLGLTITGLSSLEFTVTNAGPDPAERVTVNVSVTMVPPVPGTEKGTTQTFYSIPVGGTQKFAFGGCGVQGTGTWMASAQILPSNLGGPNGQPNAPVDPNDLNDFAKYQFVCP